MSVTLRCDGPNCDSWAKRGVNTADFLTLSGVGSPRPAWHFCTLDCCMKFCAAYSEPTQVIPT